jgi:acyl carrier protein
VRAAVNTLPTETSGKHNFKPDYCPIAYRLALKPILSQNLFLRVNGEFVMDNTAALKQDIKRLMVENLMLQISPEEIGDDQPLFGPGSLGLDSVDALQLVVAIDKTYGLKIADPEAARQILQSVTTMAKTVAKHQNSSAGKP